eukprot:TRINITY_DN33313_c0_g1_i2.p1 TRINITY_DN33313_c0_g1~~TRINITY_DN33313_c0_g1_i2.p1  ORF type:complete len:285 (+),score=77.43 TRINITY_DN33313_c0_g1_i2:60-914(+)
MARNPWSRRPPAEVQSTGPRQGDSAIAPGHASAGVKDLRARAKRALASAGMRSKGASPGRQAAPCEARPGVQAEEATPQQEPSQARPFELEVQEVMSQLLATAQTGGSSRQATPAGAPAAPTDLAAVANLQARVEQRTVQLKRDMATLAERKRALLRRGAEKELEREAEEDLQRCKNALDARAEAATRDIRAAMATARAEYEAVLAEIDDSLSVLDQVQAEVTAQRQAQSAARQRCVDSLVAWVAEAKAAQRRRSEERSEEELAWIELRADELLPDEMTAVSDT